ncbi:BA75_00915T0 [Komagataella pastoris]|uniref:BA75_00915T0 n=1 Tax=Komagataella pastoris TaxID=4922 RepID=A0A1B2J7J0_PICPA|nr:BA75_00915T0 [Komagataella pastoris]
MDQESSQIRNFHGVLVLARLLDDYISKTLQQDSVKDDTMVQNDLKWTQTEIRETISRVSPLVSKLTPNNSSSNAEKEEIFVQVCAYFGDVLDNVIVIFKETIEMSMLPTLETLQGTLCAMDGSGDKGGDNGGDLSLLITKAIEELQRER